MNLSRVHINKKNLVLVAIACAIVGTVFLLKSFAASPLASFEAENANLSGNVATGSDPTASGGKYIQFGTSGTTTPPPPPSGGHTNVSLPARAAFYYPWFPETWVVNGVHVKYNPLLGYYDSSQQSVADSHVKALDYAGVKVAIASWWGQGQHSENTRIPQLLQRTQDLNANVKWALYYEKEGFGNPSLSEIQGDLSYIKAHYATSPSYAYVNGKPVIFVYNADDTSCSLADKWAQANAGEGFYINLKVMPGYKTCASQPDSWHQYSPSSAEDTQAGYSMTISPGFWRADEASPRLARDPARWQTNVNDLVASRQPWQLITTFNEWGEGTATEAAQQWNSASGFGTYLDTLHNKQ